LLFQVHSDESFTDRYFFTTHKKGLLQNSANEKNEIDFPERGCLSHFLLEAEVVKKQIQQEQYTGKGGIYQQLTLPISENTMPKYYPINEEAAKRAKDMNSFSDYQPGSATAGYRAMVDEAYAAAERQKARVDPMYHDKIDALVDR
jgi:hypothetical protein